MVHPQNIPRSKDTILKLSQFKIAYFQNFFEVWNSKYTKLKLFLSKISYDLDIS